MIEIRIEVTKDLYFIKKEDIKKELRLLFKDFGKDVVDSAIELSPKDTGNLSQSIKQSDIEDGQEITAGNTEMGDAQVLYAKYNEPAEPEGYGVPMTRPMTRKAFMKVSVVNNLPILLERIKRMVEDKLVIEK
jgi:hypothetical protein